MTNTYPLFRVKTPTHIFAGLEFYGKYICMNGRIRVFNLETTGQSYPISDCEAVEVSKVSKVCE